MILFRAFPEMPEELIQCRFSAVPVAYGDFAASESVHVGSLSTFLSSIMTSWISISSGWNKLLS